MPKVQGKQIADQTITQNLLNLTEPSSGSTTSGATVGYVADWSLSGGTVIGPPEDDSYSTGGIFTDFTPATRVGVAVDRFNEMFKLLAPTPPTTNWASAFGTPLPTMSTASITARIIGTGASTSGVVTSTATPAFTIASTVGTGTNARDRLSGPYIFTVKDWNGSVLESIQIDSGSTGKTTGTLRYTAGDPYSGIIGQAGFWSGITGFSGASFTSSVINSGTTPRNLYFEHPSGVGKTGTTFYIDMITANTPSVTGMTMGTLPTMTRYVSGVPSLATSATFPINGFTILSASTYFYSPNPIWSLTAVSSSVTPITGDITNTLTTIYDIGNVAAQTVTISNTYTETVGWTIQAKNRSNVLAGSTTGVTYNSGANQYRYDGSNESARLVSGTGSYPAGGWGATWGTNSGVSLLTNTNELQMLNTVYTYPTVNYTAYNGPNYSTASGTRWVTFNIGTFSSNSIFYLNFIGSAGITTLPQAGLSVQIKISGATSWVDGNAAYAGVGNPGSGPDGVAAYVTANSTPTVRKITFGAITYSGSIIVRIGLTGAGITFTSITATSLG